MTIVAGIDEAGFGPLLGPMVVSATAFSVHDEMEAVSLWRQLSPAVGRSPSRKRSNIPIADSKKLYSGLRGAAGLENLERGVLAMLGAMDTCPKSLLELMDRVCLGARPAAGEYPWYAAHDLPLPHALGGVDVMLSRNALSDKLSRAEVTPVDMRSEVVFEGEYNRLVGATRNKSALLLDVTCRLLVHLWRIAAGRRLLIHVDRQGGRTHYLDALQRVFAGGTFKVLDECETYSGYRVGIDGCEIELHFSVGCEELQLPVALASMLSKYVRELWMCVFNRYWTTLLPQVAPTAGYYKDGERFWREILPQVQQMGLRHDLIYRSR